MKTRAAVEAFNKYKRGESLTNKEADILYQHFKNIYEELEVLGSSVYPEAEPILKYVVIFGSFGCPEIIQTGD